MRLPVIMMILAFTTGCSGQKIREGFYQGVYEGSRIESTRGTTPAENAVKPDMNYDQYTRQRKDILKRDQQ